MSNTVWLRDRRGLDESVASGCGFTHVARRGVRVIAPSHTLSTGGVRPQAGAPIAAMADITPDATDKGLTGVRDWSPPA